MIKEGGRGSCPPDVDIHRRRQRSCLHFGIAAYCHLLLLAVPHRSAASDQKAGRDEKPMLHGQATAISAALASG
jgi:hypothetical protein